MQSPPILWPSEKTPSNEVAAVKDLYAHLTGLQFNVEAWDAGLQLYLLSIRRPHDVERDVARRWRFVAGHECVMQLWHLKHRLNNIRGIKVKKCPSLASCIDFVRLRAAAKALSQAFPGIEELRHAVAHAGEFEAEPEVHAPDGMFALTKLGEDGQFSAPFRGQVYQLDISEQSLRTLTEVVEECFGAFRGAAEALETEGHLE
jgi:hypothetical protein